MKEVMFNEKVLKIVQSIDLGLGFETLDEENEREMREERFNKTVLERV